METLVVIVDDPTCDLLSFMAIWDLPRLGHLAVRFQGTFPVDIIPLLKRHGTHMLVL
ncbi:hypothetical protein M422DRAFT_25702, partial [Sphaerobolus stellatus SS14]